LGFLPWLETDRDAVDLTDQIQAEDTETVRREILK